MPLLPGGLRGPHGEHVGRESLEPNVVHAQHPDMSDERRTGALEEALLATSKEMRALINHQRRMIEVYTEEGMVANAGDAQLTLQPYETASNILVHTIIAQGPYTGAPYHWTLTLGSRKFRFLTPVVPIFWFDVKFQMQAQDVRSLAWDNAGGAAGGGDAFLWILGTQLPEVNF